MTEDNEYQKATKIVVDDAMRTDILGPNVCKVLREHVPTNELLEEKVTKLVNDSTKVKDALSNQIKNSQSAKISRWIERGVIFIGTILLSSIVQWILGQLNKQP